jgi:transposase-like protein
LARPGYDRPRSAISTKSTNLLERLNEEITRRTHVVRIFPNAESCLRLVQALAVEMHENWLERQPIAHRRQSQAAVPGCI